MEPKSHSERHLGQLPHWPDARGWIGIGVFIVTVMILWMMKEDRSLREDEFFQTIATMLITSGFLSMVAWAYAATKGGGELADKNAAIVAESATATVATAMNGHGKPPAQVQVMNTEENPVPTTNDTAEVELPPHAR